MDPASTLVLLILGLVASAFFSATETALTALPVSRVATLARSGPQPASWAWRRWQQRPHRVLVTILAGNNAVNIGISALATSLAIDLFGDRGVGLAVGVMTLAVLVFGEVTPKTFARVDPERLARLAIVVIGVLDYLLTPVTVPLLGLSHLLARWRKVPLGGAVVASTPEDVRFLLSLSHQEGHLSAFQHGMAEAVLRIEQATVRQVQVPRTDVAFLSDALSLEEARATVMRHGYSRYPVFHERDDNIRGILLAKDLLRPLPAGGDWLSLLQPPLYVPEGKRVVELLREMRDRRTHIALSVDEYGNIAGLMTLEDILEMIVGDIEDEFDPVAPRWVREPGGAWVVRGSLSLDRLARLTGGQLAATSDYNSVAGLLLELAGHVPARGERFDYAGLAFEVVDASPARIQRVRVSLAAPPPSPA